MAWPSLRKRVSASRICPANSAGADAPTTAPGGIRGNRARESQHAACESIARLVEADGVQPVHVVFRIVCTGIRRAPLAPKARSSPGNSVVLKVVPLTPDHAPNEAVIAWPISVICAGVFGAATVSIVGSSSAGCDVLHLRFSGADNDRFQRLAAGSRPSAESCNPRCREARPLRTSQRKKQRDRCHGQGSLHFSAPDCASSADRTRNRSPATERLRIPSASIRRVIGS